MGYGGLSHTAAVVLEPLNVGLTEDDAAALVQDGSIPEWIL